jgi:hypothetical protein
MDQHKDFDFTEFLTRFVSALGFRAHESEEVISDLKQAISARLARELAGHATFGRELEILESLPEERRTEAGWRYGMEVQNDPDYVACVASVVYAVLADWLEAISGNLSGKEKGEAIEYLKTLTMPI